MNSLLLSRITKDFLNLDPDLTPSKDRYRAGWGGSVLIPHEKAKNASKEKKRRLLAMRERFPTLFSPIESFSFPSPMPPSVIDIIPSNFRPARYFCRGVIENDRKKNPDPIAYLLIETHEISQARPVPGSLQLIRSLCKGKGILKKNSQGFVYLDIDDCFISMMLPYLKAHQPPYFHFLAAPVGAHIPVIPAREASFHYLEHIDEIGKEFSFEIEGLYSITPALWPEMQQVWFFKVHSEELEKLRRRYFLPQHPGGNPFHIVIGVLPKIAQKSFFPTMRINIAFLAA